MLEENMSNNIFGYVFLSFIRLLILAENKLLIRTINSIQKSN